MTKVPPPQPSVCGSIVSDSGMACSTFAFYYTRAYSHGALERDQRTDADALQGCGFGPRLPGNGA
jgi:hypothetical protein